jgi:hypothetical protein
MFYKLLNVYTRNFSFPHRGLKYFLKVVKSLGIVDKHCKKRLHNNFYMLLNPTEHDPETLSQFGLKPIDIYNYLNQFNFDKFLISENARLEHLDSSEISKTINVLFIHQDKKNEYPELFNK